jgi:uncharacterized membrane protein YraQ (UPF0718 family)
VSQYLLSLLYGGLGNLAAYLAAHVLLCLLPAFYIAGAMSALIPKESVTRFLGRSAPKWVAYPAAALAGSVLAVCSCTIVPLLRALQEGAVSSDLLAPPQHRRRSNGGVITGSRLSPAAKCRPQSATS